MLAGYAADAAIIAEPFGAAITTSQVGVVWFDVVVQGLPGHAAESGTMVSAIESSLPLIQALRAVEAELNASPPPPYDQYEHPISLNVGQIHAGDWNSTVPGECVTGYRIAMYPGTSVADIRARIERAIADAAATNPGAFAVPPEVRYRGFAAEGYERAARPPARAVPLVGVRAASRRASRRSSRRRAPPTRASSARRAVSRRCASGPTPRARTAWGSGCTFRAWSRPHR